ncbi:alanine/glycine:cation symporter family protein [Dethiosulfovibrio salsuginis]|uniref:Alanine or glycine:cation symporter, AGCS family n=1 Tax=Dethiosulfovibrio salsuginis TaxID=561720 RepID=A0A1X7JRQ7_9BACT|nr:sodium:alanine symporter family protein [Dethiosulfovibrio salsuginis]SMG30686.1 alanine or glycine:cation symporter, AGCS family [Dethiosulfovibrio salsuginis]
MEAVMRINGIVNGFVWGPWTLTLLVGTGIYLTVILGVPQIRYFGFMFKEVFGSLGKKQGKTEGSISSFAALATALASTVGTGNIAGVATALHLGGPGALFWMLVSAVFGMTTKFAEVTLAVHFREKDEGGQWRGGTMYVLEKGTGQKWLAWAFAFFASFASFGIGNAIQANSTAEGLSLGFGIPHLATGIVLAILTAAVIMGGISGIAKVTTYLVPFMAVFYIIGAVITVGVHGANIPDAFASAMKYAFSDPMAMPGAIAGWSIKAALTRGIARGVFSNEAGLGSAPMVHAAATVDHPVRQGVYGLFEVFTDTIVICTLTALAILTSGTLIAEPTLTGAQLSLSAFQLVLGQTGVMILSVGLALFSFSTILGWYWYGETSVTYILGHSKPVVNGFKILWIVVLLVGASGGGGKFLSNIWDMSDTMNGLMAIPNLVALLWLSSEIKKLVNDFDDKRRKGALK